jgi:hypothetical protein
VGRRAQVDGPRVTCADPELGYTPRPRTIGAVGKRPASEVPEPQVFTEGDSSEVRLAVHLRDLIARLGEG